VLLSGSLRNYYLSSIRTPKHMGYKYTGPTAVNPYQKVV